VEIQLHVVLILNFMEMSGQIHAPAALLPRKEPPYPLDRRLGGPQSRYERGAEDKKSLSLP